MKEDELDVERTASSWKTCILTTVSSLLLHVICLFLNHLNETAAGSFDQVA